MYSFVQRISSRFDVFETILFSTLLKGLITSFSPSDVAISAALAGLVAFRTHNTSKKPTKYQLDTQVQAELNELKAAITALKMERNVGTPRQRFF